MMKKLLIPALCALLLTGCVTTRPSDDTAYKAAVSAVTNNENIKINQRGAWFPNRSTINRGPNLVQGIDVNITITDKAIYCMEWNADTSAYTVTMKRNFSDITALKFTAGMLAIRTGETTWDGFGFSDHAAFAGKPEITENAYKYLKSVLPDAVSK